MRVAVWMLVNDKRVLSIDVWGGSPCTAVTPTCTDKEAGSNGVGLSMDTITWAEGDERTEDN
jgi:hypothetical protein